MFQDETQRDDELATRTIGIAVHGSSTDSSPNTPQAGDAEGDE